MLAAGRAGCVLPSYLSVLEVAGESAARPDNLDLPGLNLQGDVAGDRHHLLGHHSLHHFDGVIEPEPSVWYDALPEAVS